MSNCTENTRAMLVATGVDQLADELVLSCEVRSAKPEPEIFRHALDRLGVARRPPCSWTTRRASVRAAWPWVSAPRRSSAASLDGQLPAEGVTLVRSLPEVEALFGE